MNVRDFFDLSNRTALVTGGAAVYGNPICEALAEAGAHVIIVSRNQAQCQSGAEALIQRGLRASTDHYDQASETSILQLRDRVLQQFGCVDNLVNNSVSRHAVLSRFHRGLESQWK